MNWKRKARIQRICAGLPHGAAAYAQIQRRFGNLSADPFKRVPHHVDMLRALHDLGVDVRDARCLEVGTGHLPILPIMFHLSGATEVVTIDLRPRIQWSLLSDAMNQLVSAPDTLISAYSGLVEGDLVRSRLANMSKYADRPQEFLDVAGIRYVAPGDASSVDARDHSFDLHFSTTVLEHVEPQALRAILREAGRLLRPEGVAWHRIDPSDHFAHSDPTIGLINFLRFSDVAWHRLAGNEFGYCNRLRAPELLAEFQRAGFTIIQASPSVDARALHDIVEGFPVDHRFGAFTPEELATVGLDVAATPGVVAKLEH